MFMTIEDAPKTIYCLDCETEALDSCIKWHRLKENTMTATQAQLEVFGKNSMQFPDSGLEVDCVIITKKVDEENVEVAAVYGDSLPDAEQQAAYIVRACNAYPSLVKALNQAVSAIVHIQDDPTLACGSGTKAAIRLCGDALALAEKQ